MNESNHKLTLLGLAHCLIGFFVTPILVIIVPILEVLSNSSPSLNLPDILVISYFICLFISGICMGQRKIYRFSLAIAWIGLIFVSIITYGLTAILGLITINTLTKDSVKVLYKPKRY